LKEAIQAKKPIIDDIQLKGIFSEIDNIHKFNTILLADLEPIVAKWTIRQCLGQIFLKIVIFVIKLILLDRWIS
jgi:hypothetical protein